MGSDRGSPASRLPWPRTPWGLSRRRTLPYRAASTAMRRPMTRPSRLPGDRLEPSSPRHAGVHCPIGVSSRSGGQRPAAGRAHSGTGARFAVTLEGSIYAIDLAQEEMARRGRRGHRGPYGPGYRHRLCPRRPRRGGLQLCSRLGRGAGIRGTQERRGDSRDQGGQREPWRTRRGLRNGRG